MMSFDDFSFATCHKGSTFNEIRSEGTLSKKNLFRFQVHFSNNFIGNLQDGEKKEKVLRFTFQLSEVINTDSWQMENSSSPAKQGKHAPIHVTHQSGEKQHYTEVYVTEMNGQPI